ncbi:MAG: SIS domain-containing protein [Calditrichaceae bacterium]|nr:SIS domain-containing protein [Calditrichia bacterium]NUQ43946.1 SIS domain-containing protein [Calditrichaceae bacterium]
MDSDIHGQSLTYREIIRQQKGWHLALKALESRKENLQAIMEPFRDRTWVFSGCGTSFYLAQAAGALFEMLTGIRCRAIPASEILIFPELIFNKSDEYLLVPLSRSGTTTETVRAAQKARAEFHVPTFAISCNPQSPMSVESDLRLEFPFEPERSVVMTGSFTTMLLSVLHLGELLASRQTASSQMGQIGEVSQQVMEEYQGLMREIAADSSLEKFVFLGQGPFYGIANEAALKMQEMSLSTALSYHSLEYRHGPMSTADEHTLITILLCRGGNRYGGQLARDLKQLGAKILVFAGGDKGSAGIEADFLVRVPGDFGDLFNPMLYMPLLQLLAFHRAIEKNINPDQPKNLTAVVKLEI